MATIIVGSSSTTSQFSSKLYQACFDEDIDEICRILNSNEQKTKILTNDGDGDGPILNFSALHGKLNVVQLLIETFGADPTLEDCDGRNVLVRLMQNKILIFIHNSTCNLQFMAYMCLVF